MAQFSILRKTTTKQQQQQTNKKQNKKQNKTKQNKTKQNKKQKQNKKTVIIILAVGRFFPFFFFVKQKCYTVHRFSKNVQKGKIASQRNSL